MLRHGLRCLHVLAEIAAGILLLAIVALAGLAWRLSQGPLELPWLVHRVQEAVAAQSPGTQVAIGRLSLAWEGWQSGADQPLDLRLEAVRLTDPGGRLVFAVPRAAVTLSPAALLAGRVVLRSVELDGLRLRLRRDAEGAVSLDLGALAEAADAGAPPPAPGPPPSTPAPPPGPTPLAELARPAGTDREAISSALRQLRLVRIENAAVTVEDARLGATWSMPRATLRLQRAAAGGMAGEASAELALGAEQARLVAQIALRPDGEASLRAEMGPVQAATLARGIAALAPLAALDAPLSLRAAAAIGADLTPGPWSLDARAGPGSLAIAEGRVPLRDLVLTVAGEGGMPLDLRLDARLAAPGGDPHLTARAAIARPGGVWQARLEAALDRVSFADLPSLWPDGTDHGARRWILANIPTGIAHDATLRAEATATDLADPEIRSLHLALTGTDLAVHWLRPVAPLEGVSAALSMDGTDSLTIGAIAGHTAGLAVHDGVVRIDGLSAPHQVAHIEAGIDGPVADAMALLRSPRLHLFDHAGLDIGSPGGSLAARLRVTLPLEDAVRIDDIPIEARVKLTGARAAGLVAGRDLTEGDLDLRVTNDGLWAEGSAALAGMPATLGVHLDFRAGPPSQVVQQAEATLRATPRQMAAAGFDGGEMIAGTAALTATWQRQRGGAGTLGLTAGLQEAALAFPRPNS